MLHWTHTDSGRNLCALNLIWKAPIDNDLRCHTHAPLCKGDTITVINMYFHIAKLSHKRWENNEKDLSFPLPFPFYLLFTLIWSKQMLALLRRKKFEWQWHVKDAGNEIRPHFYLFFLRLRIANLSFLLGSKKVAL